MAKMSNLFRRLLRGLCSPEGILGTVLALWQPIMWLVGRAGDFDFLYTRWATIWEYANSSWGIAVSTFLGLCLITRAIYQTSNKPMLESPTLPLAVGVSKPLVVQLTEDERQFRVQLKHFVAASVPKLTNGAARVFSTLKTMEKEKNNDTPASIALHGFIHWAVNGGISRRKLEELTSVSLEQMDTKSIWQELQTFFIEYEWRQKWIANLNAIVEADLPNLESMKNWLALDNECCGQLDNLNVWAETVGFKKLPLGQMATRDQLWKTPVKVNYS